MFMRKMRGSASLVMGIMAAAFVGWLVFDGINAMQGARGQVNPVVGQVGGQDSAQRSGTPSSRTSRGERVRRSCMTDEDVRIVTEAAWRVVVSATLIQAELDRLRAACGRRGRRRSSHTAQEMLSYPAVQHGRAVRH